MKKSVQVKRASAEVVKTEDRSSIVSQLFPAEWICFGIGDIGDLR